MNNRNNTKLLLSLSQKLTFFFTNTPYVHTYQVSLNHIPFENKIKQNIQIIQFIIHINYSPLTSRITHVLTKIKSVETIYYITAA